MTAIQPAGPANLSQEEVLFEGPPAIIHSVASLLLVIATAGLAFVWLYFKRGGTRYRITNQRIVIDRGILSKRMEQLDLYRIQDFTVDRPLGQRIMGTGNIRLSTFDKTTPVVELFALKTDVVTLYEVLRRAVEANKAARGVRTVDYES